jgi:3'-phosphoadenosine 5'-phosphosulfate sulfotransferase (PAPS reductase)/FAD synthetase
MSEIKETKKPRHILGLSGGKDSTALAIYMRDKVPDMEYVFTDTGAELPECYEYLDKLENFLGKPVVRLNSGKTFDHWLEVYSGYLPSANARWCTKVMKLFPFEKYIGNDLAYSYVGIRADEDREGYVSHKKNLIPVFPFKEAGLGIKEVAEILDRSGLGLPEYYKWRTRSGCYFCFFQQRNEWVGLKERHPDLFAKAKTYEKPNSDGRGFTWIPGKSLDYIEKNAEEIKRNAEAKKAAAAAKKTTLFEQLSERDEDEPQACLICEL